MINLQEKYKAPVDFTQENDFNGCFSERIKLVMSNLLFRKIFIKLNYLQQGGDLVLKKYNL